MNVKENSPIFAYNDNCAKPQPRIGWEFCEIRQISPIEKGKENEPISPLLIKFLS